MKKMIFILGGSRSGKSNYAVNLAKTSRGRVIFIATCIPGDSEMRERIRLHKKSRPRSWRLIEEGIYLDSVLNKLKGHADTVLIDCLGLFVSNLMAVEADDKKIKHSVERVIDAITKIACTVIVVSNEVGMGIVPDNSLARRFRDLLGNANQALAQNADTVLMMYAGIPMVIKP